MKPYTIDGRVFLAFRKYFNTITGPVQIDVNLTVFAVIFPLDVYLFRFYQLTIVFDISCLLVRRARDYYLNLRLELIISNFF
jgi:hypothetical protein